MAEGGEEDLEWNSSKIKGFSFGDNDETPWEELSRLQTSSSSSALSTSSSTASLPSLLSSGRSAVGFEASSDSTSIGSTGSSGVVSDRVKAVARSLASGFGQDWTAPISGPSLSEVLGTGGSDSRPLPEDIDGLRQELRHSRRQLSKLELSRFTPLHPKETIQNIFFGKDVSLEFYKSISDKKALVDEALNFGDGDAILTVTLFLYRTLSRNQLAEVLKKRPKALSHLVHYLKVRAQINELNELQLSIGTGGLSVDAVITLYSQQIVSKNSIESRGSRIRSLLKQRGNINWKIFESVLEQHAHLLERLGPVAHLDRQLKVDNDDVGALVESKNESVMRMLLYLCYNHYTEPENLLSSPTAFKKALEVSDLQYLWIAFIAQCKRGAFSECETLLLSKTWMGGRKCKLNVTEAISVLHEHKASADVMYPYVMLIEDLEERENVARRCQVPNAVIDTYVSLRDREALQRFAEKLKSHSPEWFYANHALNASGVKWKN